MKKKISFIIPVYNAEKYVSRAIESVLNQTYKNIELIIINDGSKDSSLSICKSYQAADNRIIIIDKENQGVSSARNDGIKKASGDYIMFLDADDYVEKNIIEDSIKIIELNNVDMVRYNYYRQTRRIKIKNKFNISLNTIIPADSEIIKESIFLTDIFCPCWGTLYNANIVKKLSFNSNLRVGEDFLFVSEYIKKSNSIYISDKCMYHYMVYQGSVTHNSSISKGIINTCDAIKANIAIEKMFYDPDYIIKKQPRQMKSKRCILSFINSCVSNNNYKFFQDFLFQIRLNDVISDEIKILENLTLTEKGLLSGKYLCYLKTKIIILPKKIAKELLF